MPRQPKLEDAAALLARTPATLDALLRGLPESWTHRDEGPGTWNAASVVAHLIHAERADWMPRVRHILREGESRAFEPFDRAALLALASAETLEHLLDEFSHSRATSLRDLAALNLTPADLERRGRHPTLGSVALSELLATWVAHDADHLHQIARILAHQYRTEVGPWHRHLGVLRCDGHGD